MDQKELLTQLQTKMNQMGELPEGFKSVVDMFNAAQKKADEINALLGERKDGDEKTIEQKFADFSEAHTKLQEEVKSLKEAKKNEFLSLKEAFEVLVDSKEFKEAKEAKSFDGNGKSFELKVDTTAMTGAVTRTQIKPGVSFEKEAINAILPLFRTVPMGIGKDRALWMEGAYTSNCGYVGEGTAIGTADTGTAEEKTRELAKISAKLKLTAEMFEDLPSLAAQFEFKLRENTWKFLNKELLGGVGNDTNAKKKIYGLITQGCTAFAAPAKLATAIPFPTIDDLVAVANAQAGEYDPNVVVMSKIDAVKYGRVKDTTGQYVIREVNGMKMLGGLRVVETSNITDNTMMLLDTATLQLHMKRNLEFKISQEATDFTSDQYTAVTFLRCQSVIENLDKKGNIYISDIDAALLAIKKA